ncbi:MAG: hypothetical protein HXY50_13590 [Ignavibacteriaceae bacterium]|nr:hypothetical protein [Ignavibacteriaceae bacterium]
MSRIRISIFLFMLFIIEINNTIAQSSSSYSRFGVGDEVYSFSSRRLGMGQVGTSVADADFISIANPASLYKLNKTRIEFSVNYNGIFLANANQTNYLAASDFGGFAVGIPISNSYGVGAAFGLVPVSNVSYKALERQSSASSLIGDYSIEYSGSGGLSKVFIGSSFTLLSDISVGASFDYLFGNISYNSSVEFVNTSSFSSKYEKRYRYRGIGGTFGVIGPDFAKILELQSISDFRFGLALNLASSLNVDSFYFAESLVGVDTASMGNHKAKIPLSLSIGTNCIFNKKYLVYIDYTTQAWSKFSSNGAASESLQDAYKLSMGFEYRPLRELGSSFWEQVILRAGLSYEKTQYSLFNTSINQYSFSAGVSLPIGYENTLDFGLLYARRGTKDSNLLQEDIIKLSVGFSLGELWFIRQDK